MAERAYNDPNFAAAASGLAKLFAPPDLQSIYLGQKMQADRQAAAERETALSALPQDVANYARAGIANPVQSYTLADLYGRATHLPSGADLKALDPAVYAVHGNYGQTASGTREAQANDLAKTSMAPLSENQTRYFPPHIAKQLGLMPQQFGIVSAGKDSTVNLPGTGGSLTGDDGDRPTNPTIAGPQSPDTLEQSKARVFADMPKELQSAVVFGSTPLERVAGQQGATYATRPQAIGQPAAPEPQAPPQIAQLQSYRDAIIAKLGPDHPRVKEVTAAIDRLGQGQTINVNGSETERDKQAGGAVGKAIGAYVEDVRPAQAQAKYLDVIEDALRRGEGKITTGPFAQFALQSKQALSSTFGLDLEGVPEAEVAQKAGFNLATQAVKEISARPSQMEFGKALENNPGLLLSVPGSLAMIGILKQTARQRIELGRLASDKRNWDNWPDVVDRYYAAHPIMSPFDPSRPLGAKDLDTLQAAGGAPGGPAAGQTGGAPRRVTSPEEASRLPSGTLFLDPTGKVRVRP